MPFANYIYEYFSGIQSGKYTVGKWVRLIYEIIIAGLERGEYFFNAKKANKAIKFIENFCHHCEGREDLLKLEVWQKACVSVIFGIVDADGLRVFREVFIVIGRKNGKTLFASAIIAYMAYLDGEYGAKIYCLAPKLDQAAIVYDNFYQMLKKEPELAELAKKRRSDIYIEDTNTVVKPLAFNAKKSDGFNPHLVVNDEVASWRGDGGLKQYEVMKSALGARRQPLILSISTAGYENDGIYDELMKRSTAFLKGNSKERRLLPFLYMIDDVEKWNDMAKKTFMQYYGLVDETGQPVGRVNYGIAGKPERALLGRPVICCDYVPSVATAAKGGAYAFLFNFKDYVLNTNYTMTVKKYEDNDTDDMVTKAIMLVDGKVIDKNSLVVVAKAAGA